MLEEQFHPNQLHVHLDPPENDIICNTAGAQCQYTSLSRVSSPDWDAIIPAIHSCSGVRLREVSWLDTGMQDRDVYYGDRGSRIYGDRGVSDRGVAIARGSLRVSRMEELRGSRIEELVIDRSRIATGIEDRGVTRIEDRGVSDRGVAIEDRVVFQVKGWRSRIAWSSKSKA